MRILINGLSARWGLPLAVALRDYGGHSVVGWGIESNYGVHVDPEVQAQVDHLPIPLAPSLPAAIAEGSDLVFIATRPTLVQHCLDQLAAHWKTLGPRQGPLICVAVVPLGERDVTHVHPGVLSVGYAPFLFNPHKALGRLLNLRKIEVVHLADRHHPWRGGLLARSAVANAWTPINNKIPIREQTVLVGGGPL